MIAEQIFEKYLEYRIQKAGALTPGQKLDVIHQLQDEAHQGMIPAGENSVARVPLDSPVVQAILRGEPVSVGDTTVRRKTGVQNWSTGQKLALMAGIVLFIMVFTIGGVMLLRGSKQAAPEETATREPSSTPYPTETPIPSDTPTLMPAPTETETHTPLVLGIGAPAEDANAPASLEVRGHLFVLEQGQVEDKTGTWHPQGDEWLNGTEVRRVIALPLAQVADLPIQPGDSLTLRTRNGRVVIYPVTQILHLTMNQIETFMSLSPSIIVTLFDPATANSADNPQRLAVIGELNQPPTFTATPIIQRALVMNNANLRVNPSTKAEVIAGLVKGTWLDVAYPLQTQSTEGMVWVFVHSSFGNGWVVRSFLSFH